MDVDFVKTSIGSFKTRLKDREADALRGFIGAADDND